MALIEVHEGNSPVPNIGWPTGTEEVANLPSRLGFMVGPPFGGGSFFFKYSCEDTNEFNDALEKFSKIIVPSLTCGTLRSFTGHISRIHVEKPLLLAVHDWAPDEIGGREFGNKPAVWTFTVWSPRNFYRLYYGPENASFSDHPNYWQTVPPPRIDVYVGDDSPIVWDQVDIPNNIEIVDKRRESAPVNLEKGGEIQGRLFDMKTHQVIAEADVVLVNRDRNKQSEKELKTTSNENGYYEITEIPEGYYQIHVHAENYVSRNIGTFDNRSGYKFLEMDTLLITPGSLQGSVTDPDGNPIRGLQVEAENTMGIDGLGYICVQKPSTTTDGNGQFTLSSLPEGYTQIRCRAPSLHQETNLFEIYRVSNFPEERSKDIHIIMTGTGVVEGKVTGPNGNPPSCEFIVEIEPKGGHKVGSWGGSMKCKPDGTFAFKGVPPGEYLLTAHPNPMRQGEASEPIKVTMEAGRTVEVEIENEDIR